MSVTGQTGLVSRFVGALRQVTGPFIRVIDRVVSITIGRPRETCAGVPGLPEGHKTNPVQCNDVTVTAFGAGGGLMVYPGRSQPETLVRQEGGIKGFDAASQLETRFPPSPKVVVRVAHFGQPGRTAAYSGGVVTGMQPMAPTTGVIQEFTFTSGSIDRVVVMPAVIDSEPSSTIVLELCH